MLQAIYSCPVLVVDMLSGFTNWELSDPLHQSCSPKRGGHFMVASTEISLQKHIKLSLQSTIHIMAHLLDLPNELLDQIISQLRGRCADLCSLSLVSRRLYDLTKSTLYSIYSWKVFDENYSFRPFIRSILEDRQLATHVRVAKIREWQTDHAYSSMVETPALARRSREDLNLFLEAGRYVPLKSEPDWHSSMTQVSEDAEVMLLLAQLANLQELHMAMPPTTRLRFQFVLSEAQKARRGVPAMYHSLRKLSVENGASDGGFQLGTLAPFLALPSLRVLELYRCKVGTWTIENFQDFGEANQGVFGITSINLEWSSLNVEAITALIRSCKALKSFSFSHFWGTDPIHGEDQFKTRELMEALGYHKDTLEHLRLDLHTGWDSRLWLALLQEEDFRYGDLRRFHKLTTLDAEESEFISRNPALQNSNGPMAAILTGCIETLIIRSCSDLICPYLLNLTSSYKNHLPRLKEIRITSIKERKTMMTELSFNSTLWNQQDYLKKLFGPDVAFEIKMKPDDKAGGITGFHPPVPSWRWGQAWPAIPSSP